MCLGIMHDQTCREASLCPVSTFGNSSGSTVQSFTWSVHISLCNSASSWNLWKLMCLPVAAVQIFAIQGNNFSGTVPASLGTQQSLTLVQLDENPLRYKAGGICLLSTEILCHLSRTAPDVAAGWTCSGPIPDTFNNLQHLTTFTALRGTLRSDYYGTSDLPGALLPSFLQFDL